MINKRWYDRDPILKEALELLRLSPDTTKTEAADSRHGILQSKKELG